MKIEMKMRTHSNKDYLDCIYPTIYVLISSNKAQITFNLLRKKLKGKSLEIFDKITLYYGMIEFAKVSSKINLANIERRQELLRLKEKTEGMFEAYLSSIDSLEFFDCIANIAYDLAGIEIKRKFQEYSSLLNDWQVEHNYLISKNKNEGLGKQTKDALRVIIGDQVDNIDKIKKEHLEEVGRLEEGKSPICINLEEEIGLSSVEYGNYDIIRTRNINGQLLAIIQDNAGCIIINDKEYTLNEYYESKKMELDRSWLTSKDLLKKILIVYLIKRAQKGDEYAFNKMFSFYKDAAKELALGFLKLKTIKYSTYEFNQGGKLSNENVESAIYSILTSFLKGDSPSLLFEYLDAKPSEKKDLLFLNKKPSNALHDSLRDLFKVVEQQKNLRGKELETLKNTGKDFRYRAKNAKSVETKIDYLNKLFRLSQVALANNLYSLTIFPLFNPISLLDISPEYNKYLYKPSKDHNLTTWLFGKKNTEFRGMLYQALQDWYKGQTHTVNGRRYIDENDYKTDDVQNYNNLDFNAPEEDGNCENY